MGTMTSASFSRPGAFDLSTLTSRGDAAPAAGTVTFEITHFSLYAVGYNPVEFADVAPAAAAPAP